MRLAALILVAICITQAELNRARLDAKCEALCPLVRKGNTGRGNAQGGCDCVNSILPEHYADVPMQLPKRLGRKAPEPEKREWKRETDLDSYF